MTALLAACIVVYAAAGAVEFWKYRKFGDRTELVRCLLSVAVCALMVVAAILTNLSGPPT